MWASVLPGDGIAKTPAPKWRLSRHVKPRSRKSIIIQNKIFNIRRVRVLSERNVHVCCYVRTGVCVVLCARIVCYCFTVRQTLAVYPCARIISDSDLIICVCVRDRV